MDPELPLTSQLSLAELNRLLEGIRVYRNVEDAKLILSRGIGGNGPFTDAEMMESLAITLGIPEDDIILESESLDTIVQAKLIKQIVNDDKFILVTSASHMPRAMAIFKKCGMCPVPALADFMIKKYGNTFLK